MDGFSKYIDPFVVSCYHAHSDRNEIFLLEGKAFNDIHAGHAALTASDRYLESPAGDFWRSHAKGLVVLWAHCGCECNEWLWFR